MQGKACEFDVGVGFTFLLGGFSLVWGWSVEHGQGAHHGCYSWVLEDLVARLD